MKIKNLATGLVWTKEEYEEIVSLGTFEQVEKRPTSIQEVISQLEGVDYAIIPPVPGEIIANSVFDKCPKLKGISLVTTRYFWIDIKAARGKNIIISNLGDYSTVSVAELAIGMMFCLARNITPSVISAKKGNRWFQGFRGIDLFGKVLGVIGTGSIGKEVIRISKGIGMVTIAYNRTKEKCPCDWCSINELLAVSDVIVVLHALF